MSLILHIIHWLSEIQISFDLATLQKPNFGQKTIVKRNLPYKYFIFVGNHVRKCQDLGRPSLYKLWIQLKSQF